MPESLRCPKCGADIAEALTAKLNEQVRGQLAAEAEAGRRALAAREEGVRLREAQAREKEQHLAQQVKERVDAEVRVATEKAEREAQAKAGVDRQALESQLRRALAAEHALAVGDRDSRIEGLTKTIDELKRKADQGSQQSQGEVLESLLEDLLRREFPTDSVEPVPKGMRGADLVQRVRGPGGAECGVILWEAKRTKAWANDWLPKLRDDQRVLKAQFAVLVTQTLPKDAPGLSHIDGVWVTTFASGVAWAHALRHGLIELAGERRSQEGRGDKMALLYAYLNGPDFRSRIEGLIDPFRAMQEELDAEKRATEKAWVKRAQQIQRALRSLSGMKGDIEGISHVALPDLEAPALPGGSAAPLAPRTP